MCSTNEWNRRTYGRDAGEDIREGYEPGEDAVDDENADPFSVGDEDASPYDSEESKQWKQAAEATILLQPKYGVDGEAFENVWEGGPSQSPKENP